MYPASLALHQSDLFTSYRYIESEYVTKISAKMCAVDQPRKSSELFLVKHLYKKVLQFVFLNVLCFIFGGLTEMQYNIDNYVFQVHKDPT